MKKVIVVLIVAVLSLGFYAGVNKARYVYHLYGGMSVGGGSAAYDANTPNEIIDSIRVISGMAYIYSSGDTIPVYVPVADQIDGSTVYYKLLPDTVTKTASFTVSATEVSKDVHCWKATSTVITVPQNLSDWGIGRSINIFGLKAILVVKAAAGVTFISDTTGTALASTGGIGALTIKKIAANKYLIIGDTKN